MKTSVQQICSEPDRCISNVSTPVTATQTTSLFRPTTEVFTLSPHLSQATRTKEFLYKCKFPLCFILYMQIGDVKTRRLTLSNCPADNERHFKRVIINVDDYFFRVWTIMWLLNTLTCDRFVLMSKVFECLLIRGSSNAFSICFFVLFFYIYLIMANVPWHALVNKKKEVKLVDLSSLRLLFLKGVIPLSPLDYLLSTNWQRKQDETTVCANSSVNNIIQAMLTSLLCFVQLSQRFISFL